MEITKSVQEPFLLDRAKEGKTQQRHTRPDPRAPSFLVTAPFSIFFFHARQVTLPAPRAQAGSRIQLRFGGGFHFICYFISSASQHPARLVSVFFNSLFASTAPTHPIKRVYEPRACVCQRSTTKCFPLQHTHTYLTHMTPNASPARTSWL